MLTLTGASFSLMRRRGCARLDGRLYGALLLVPLLLFSPTSASCRFCLASASRWCVVCRKVQREIHRSSNREEVCSLQSVRSMGKGRPAACGRERAVAEEIIAKIKLQGRSRALAVAIRSVRTICRRGCNLAKERKKMEQLAAKVMLYTQLLQPINNETRS